MGAGVVLADVVQRNLTEAGRLQAAEVCVCVCVCVCARARAIARVSAFALA